jgi:hypothetical protein
MTTNPPNDALPFFSPFTQELHGKCIGISQDKINEFLTEYSILHRRLQRSLQRFLRTLEQHEIDRQQEGWSNSTKKGTTAPIDGFLDTIYDAAELYEFYEKRVVPLLNPSGKARKLYMTAIKGLQKEAKIICNKCKHNRAFLQYVEILYADGQYVTGFALYQMHGHLTKLNTDLHNLRQAFSFNWAIRRLIGNLMLAEQEAAKLVLTLEEKPSEEISSLSFTLPFFKELETITARPEVAMPLEIRAPNLHKTYYNEIIIERAPKITSRFGKGKMIVYVDIIAQSAEFEIPYMKNENNVKVDNKNALGEPTALYRRAVVRSNDVEDK